MHVFSMFAIYAKFEVVYMYLKTVGGVDYSNVSGMTGFQIDIETSTGKTGKGTDGQGKHNDLLTIVMGSRKNKINKTNKLMICSGIIL